MACVEPYVYAGNLTLLECQEVCISRNCEYIRRPSTYADTVKSSCWYSYSGGKPTGNCQGNVYYNKGMVQGVFTSMSCVQLFLFLSNNSDIY